MTRPIAVLRPEPGNAATAARVEAAGHRAIRLPLFAVRPLDWRPPGPEHFDGLLLTSANAVRHAGAQLAAVLSLPVIAVGRSTADAARAAGLRVETVGENGIADALARNPARHRLLHLAGRNRMPAPAVVAATIDVYASELRSISRAEVEMLGGSVALLHSARAARRLAELAAGPNIAIAAFSEAVADAAGAGWRAIAIANAPDDAALIAAAIALAD